MRCVGVWSVRVWAVPVRGMAVRGMAVRGMAVRGMAMRGVPMRGVPVPGQMAMRNQAPPLVAGLQLLRWLWARQCLQSLDHLPHLLQLPPAADAKLAAHFRCGDILEVARIVVVVGLPIVVAVDCACRGLGGRPSIRHVEGAPTACGLWWRRAEFGWVVSVAFEGAAEAGGEGRHALAEGRDEGIARITCHGARAGRDRGSAPAPRPHVGARAHVGARVLTNREGGDEVDHLVVGQVCTGGRLAAHGAHEGARHA